MIMVVIFLGGEKSVWKTWVYGETSHVAAKDLGVVHLKLYIYFEWFSASVFYFTIKRKDF